MSHNSKGFECPLCLSQGKKSLVRLLQISIGDALVGCEDPECWYPFGVDSQSMLVRRSYKTLKSNKHNQVRPQDLDTPNPSTTTNVCNDSIIDDFQLEALLQDCSVQPDDDFCRDFNSFLNCDTQDVGTSEISTTVALPVITENNFVPTSLNGFETAQKHVLEDLSLQQSSLFTGHSVENLGEQGNYGCMEPGSSEIEATVCVVADIMAVPKNVGETNLNQPVQSLDPDPLEIINLDNVQSTKSPVPPLCYVITERGNSKIFTVKALKPSRPKKPLLPKKTSKPKKPCIPVLGPSSTTGVNNVRKSFGEALKYLESDTDGGLVKLNPKTGVRQRGKGKKKSRREPDLSFHLW